MTIKRILACFVVTWAWLAVFSAYVLIETGNNQHRNEIPKIEESGVPK